MNQKTIDKVVQDEILPGDFLKLKGQRPLIVSRKVGDYCVEDKSHHLYNIKNVEIYRSKNNGRMLEITYYKK